MSQRDIVKDLEYGYMLVNSQRYSEAVEHLNKFIEAFPYVVQGLVARGTALAGLGRVSEAIRDFDKVTEIDKTSPEGHLRKAMIYVQINEFKEGVEALNKAIELSHGKSVEAYQMRGKLYQVNHYYDLAVADYKKATELDPKNFNLWNSLGLNYFGIGYVDEASDAYRHTLELKPDFVDGYLNVATLYKDAGEIEKSKVYFKKLFQMCPESCYGHYMCGMMYHAIGDHVQALSELNRAIYYIDNEKVGLPEPDKRVELLRHLGVTLQATGLYRQANKVFNILLGLNEKDVAWYMREMSLYNNHMLDKPFEQWNPETLDPMFKEGFCKRLDPKLCVTYTKQSDFDENVPDVDLSCSLSPEVIEKLIKPALEIGKFMKYNSRGFVANQSQFLMGGLAAIQIGKMIREKIPAWKTGGLSENEASKYLNVFKWRDIMAIAVKWRQISEPNDQVFWTDGLTHDEFVEGIGSHTPIFSGIWRAYRYYSQYPRTFKMARDLLPKQFQIDKDKKEKIKTAKDIGEMLDILGCDFHVHTPCGSENFANVEYEGTHLLAEKKYPRGYGFAIKTLCSQDRYDKYSRELDECWKNIVKNVLMRKGDKDNKKILRSILSMMYYWYVFMPLSRGSAACGLLILFSLLASCGKKLNKNIPEGMQTDWEAILNPKPSEFDDIMVNWMYDGIIDLDIDSIPKVEEMLPTLRDVIIAFNNCSLIKV